MGLGVYKSSKGQNLAALPFRSGMSRFWVCLWPRGVLEDACMG